MSVKDDFERIHRFYKFRNNWWEIAGVHEGFQWADFERWKYCLVKDFLLDALIQKQLGFLV